MFTAYTKISNNRYRETFGLDFEQFQVGQIFQHRPGITISQQDNVEESLDTSNCAQLHYDAHYASQTEFRNCLVVSTLTLQKLIGSSWKTFARKERISSFEEISMTSPIFDGDTLYSENEILETKDIDDIFGELFVEMRGYNQCNDLFTKVRCRILVFKAGKHPYYRTLPSNGILEGDKFSAHYLLDNGVYREKTGIFFDDFIVGEIYEHAPSKFIGKSEALKHALHSLDWNPRYTDPSFAAEYFDEQVPPVTEMYALGAYTTPTTRTLGRVVANLGWHNIKIERHIYPEERVYVESEILNKKNSKSRPTQGILKVATRVFDKNHDPLCSFNRTLLVYKKDDGPYTGAGY